MKKVLSHTESLQGVYREFTGSLQGGCWEFAQFISQNGSEKEQKSYMEFTGSPQSFSRLN
jgi:hypothetical protein